MECDYKQINIQIVTFGVNSSAIEGLADFEADLKSIYNVDKQNQECVACGGSSELDLIVDISTFIAGSAVSGMVWDLLKSGLDKLWKVLKKLWNRNQGLTLYITIKLDGYDLKVSEAMSSCYGTLESVLLIIEEGIQYLGSKGFSDIKCISMPYIETNDKENRFAEKEPYKDFKDYWWKVEYNNGNNQLYFNPNTLEIFIQS